MGLARMVLMHPRLRLIFSWLLLAALPWQGVAAASMALCQPAMHASAVPAAAHDDATAHAVPLASDGHHHAHASPVSLAAGDGEALGRGLQAEADHQCSACSMCGHVLGLPGVPFALDAPPAHQSLTLGALRRADSRVAPVPDKPPRA